MKLGKAMGLLAFAAGILISTWTTQVSAATSAAVAADKYKDKTSVDDLGKEQNQIRGQMATFETLRSYAQKAPQEPSSQANKDNYTEIINDYQADITAIEDRIAVLTRVPPVQQNGKL
eukprot:GHVT01032292.1.p1 GENE.GHVT01032292.1~~GHVT01032292.1.p1  ORF type:complete len:118 (+),score=7.78 GHVT01032292.1:85-438(+)